MKIENFVQLFAEQFDDTPAEIFTQLTVYKDLKEWSSLTALSIIAMIDEEFDKSVTGAELRRMNTIEELFRLIEVK